MLSAAPLAGGLPTPRTIVLAMAPNVAWCGFFLAMWRRPERVRSAAIAVLVLAIPARVLFLAAYLGSTLNMGGVGWIIVGAECAAVTGWALLLVTLVAKLRRPPLETTASVLAVAVCVASIDDVFLAASRLLSAGGTALVFWRNNPLGTFGRLVGEPVLQLYSVATQVFFLRALATARDAETRAAWGEL